MSVIAGDPHRIFIVPTAQHARKRRLRTGEVHDYWRTGGRADSVPAQSAIAHADSRHRVIALGFQVPRGRMMTKLVIVGAN
jgi:hypothetical protein